MDHKKYNNQLVIVNLFTQICREAWGETNAEKCHDISSYTISNNHVIELEVDSTADDLD